MKEMVKIKLSDIDSFENHPFKINKDEMKGAVLWLIEEKIKTARC